MLHAVPDGGAAAAQEALQVSSCGAGDNGIGLLGALPAAGVRRSPFIATFIYACDASNPAPRLRVVYTVAGRPKPRPAKFPIAVYSRGEAPSRRCALIGKVQLLASGARTSLPELTDYASRGARKLGGDATVDMIWTDAASARPKAGDVGLPYLTADVARWE